MTVKELIDKLEEIKDKELEVKTADQETFKFFYDINGVELLEGNMYNFVNLTIET